MRGILLDIEGTTTPIQFVYDVLFPYARKHVDSWFVKHQEDPDFISDLRILRKEYEDDCRQGLEPPGGSLIEYCLWLMDRDRKSTGLKSIQGKVWAAGYKSGELRGEVFPDVPPALRDWFSRGVDVRIFSSGSVFAQKLLFANSIAGDLTGYLQGYFDTSTGPKTLSESYLRIGSEMRCKPSDITFVSDVVSELDAAGASGMEVLLCMRPGNRQQPAHGYKVVRSFDEIHNVPSQV